MIANLLLVVPATTSKSLDGSNAVYSMMTCNALDGSDPLNKTWWVIENLKTYVATLSPFGMLTCYIWSIGSHFWAIWITQETGYSKLGSRKWRAEHNISQGSRVQCCIVQCRMWWWVQLTSLGASFVQTLYHWYHQCHKEFHHTWFCLGWGICKKKKKILQDTGWRTYTIVFHIIFHSVLE